MFSTQFILAQRAVAAPPDWAHRQWGDWILQHAPDLFVIPFESPRASGLILGWPIVAGRLRIDDDLLRLADHDGPPLFAGVSGRFLALVHEPEGQACYLDPCGLLPAVYSPRHARLASTPTLVPAAEDDRAAAELRAAFDIPAKGNWYPFGLTGAAGVHRLLPNHRLDLATMTARRVWPTVWPVPAGPREIGAHVFEIARLLAANVEAVALQPEAVCNLTAGRDTRMLLAALRPHVERVRITTIRLPDRIGDQDCRVARAITRRHGLAHLELDYDEPLQADMDEWLENTGHCIGGRTLQLATTSRRIASLAKFSLSGIGGEIGRGFPWPRADDFERDEISVSRLLARVRLRAPLVPAVEEAGRRWLAELPKGSMPGLFKVAFIELNLASGAGPSFYGHSHGGISISPFNDRRMIERMLSLPHEYRFREQLTADLIDRLWPELAYHPFNPASCTPAQLRRQRLTILAKRFRGLGRKIGIGSVSGS